MPLIAATVVVPESVEPPGFAPMAIEMFPTKLVAVFPNWSRARMSTAGVIAAPATLMTGWLA